MYSIEVHFLQRKLRVDFWVLRGFVIRVGESGIEIPLFVSQLNRCTFLGLNSSLR